MTTQHHDKLTDLKIKHITDGWVGILFINDNPVLIHWNLRQQGSTHFVKIINKNTWQENIAAGTTKHRTLLIDGTIEKLTAEPVKKRYEFYFDPTQRYYSEFVHLFNRYNNEYTTIPTRDKEFYYTHVRVFNWQQSFLTTKEHRDDNQIRHAEDLLKSGQRPYVTIYQHYISQQGIYDDGYGWASSHISPFFIVDGNYIYRAYKNLNIAPKFVLYTEKVRGDGQREFKADTTLLNALSQRFLTEEELSLIKKYRR